MLFASWMGGFSSLKIPLITLATLRDSFIMMLMDNVHQRILSTVYIWWDSRKTYLSISFSILQFLESQSLPRSNGNKSWFYNAPEHCALLSPSYIDYSWNSASSRSPYQPHLNDKKVQKMNHKFCIHKRPISAWKKCSYFFLSASLIWWYWCQHWECVGGHGGVMWLRWLVVPHWHKPWIETT